MTEHAALAAIIFAGTAAIVAARRMGNKDAEAGMIVAVIGLISGLMWVWK